MLGRLNEFLFGSGETENVAVDETQASQQVDLDTKEGDLGWELVVVPGREGNSSQDETGEEWQQPKRRRSSRQKKQRQQAREEACGLVKDSSNPPSSAAELSSDGVEVLTEGDIPSSDCESQDSARDLVMRDRGTGGPRLASQLGESWIVTPPPCFTGTDSINTQLSSSPLENLLIEHPSMSVYNSLQEGQGGLDEEEELQEDSNRPQEMEVARPNVGPAVPNRPARSVVDVAQQIKLTHCHQRRQQVECRKQLNRKNFERSNKARMVNSTCRKHIAARNRILKPSGCMNSRRSQRAF